MENVTNVLLHPNGFKYICRTCLMHDHDNLFIIAEVSWEGVELKDIIRDWTKLEVDDDDWNFPKQMCKACIKQMYQTYSFLSRCKNSEKRIKEIICHEKFETQKRIEQCETQLDSSHAQDDEMIEEICTEYQHQSEGNAMNEEDQHQSENRVVNETLIIKEEASSDTTEGIPEVELENVEEFILKEIDSTRDEISRIKRNLYTVEETARKKASDKKKTYMCSRCGVNLCSRKNLEKHYKQIHKKLIKYELCNCKSKGLDEQCQRHLGKKPFRCDLCDMFFCLEDTWKKHMNIHSVKEPKQFAKDTKLKCDFCDNEYENQSKLRYHVETIHSNHVYVCDDCGKTFMWKKSFLQHQRVHAGDPTSPCNMCHLVLANKSLLDLHLRSHHGETFEDGKHFDDECDLIHEKKDNYFACNLCKGVFSDFRTFKEHVQSHTRQQFLLSKLPETTDVS